MASAKLKGMIYRFLSFCALLSLLGSCYSLEMVLEDPVPPDTREAELCLETLPTETALSTEEAEAFQNLLLRQFPRELRLNLSPGKNCSHDLRLLSQGQALATENEPPLILKTRVRLRELKEMNPTYPLGWPGPQNRSAQIEMQMRLGFELWQKSGPKRLQASEVTESGKGNLSDRAELLARLQEKLLQKSLLELQPRYRYLIR
ncbi:hypothetical protein COW36_02260 [bacterium (Candidatus Blackallbacteria) CG17_big_fil_post_rev_8_21_14_2_50_48_46]|uniref:Lipoprotein n=1 Tax=bacterium (Candidatus Blackallbacteria) CG17_big_fil_post_rev_8_21_14_2_50_48_46 TaxID=2014261 RepID=A0A2M7GA34_9BACT|nr:MAG: hypothetical protein COW64_13210 [bacterium (Candidatus Blackallbacteria) CG18_big_fil_WC_8_21_14_2_50_49_26]PIW18954.1 MAG: hypothetical protein COW36_02260 [bacterium (Candidatus Blackallbacteria) CG17_big_fil_post_rev_8_21_14_2_50_48_46]PIW44678.1 MAG: hypothetical protein COW20_23855 [bacterium (Candidatus Blackallbacteria) CG13_big_fil_rev_8_21_14_2_50_49_14]